MLNQEVNKVQEEGLIDVTAYISDYLHIARKMWAWFLVLALIGSGFGYLKERMNYSPRYTASATFTINIRQEQGSGDGTSTYFDNTAAEQMATTFPYILTSGVLKRKVLEDLGERTDTSVIKAEAVPNTNLFTISVTDSVSGRAYAVLQSVIENYPALSEVIIGKTYMEMLDETGVPEQPDNPKDFKMGAIKGGIAGAILVAMWCLLLVFTRRTVRKEEEVRKRIHTKCLGTIPRVIRKKRSKRMERTNLVITDKAIEEKLLEHLHMIRNKIEYYMREYKHQVFVITSAVAGEGKSTVAVNLALTFAKAGRKVALIDCDLRHPSDRTVLGVEDDEGLTEILEGTADVNECILSATEVGIEEDLDIRFILGGKAVEDGTELLGSDYMGDIIEGMKNWADIVILDTAPSGLLTDSVVLAQYADAAVFVVRKDFARVEDILDGMEHLAESNVHIVGSVLNGV